MHRVDREELRAALEVRLARALDANRTGLAGKGTDRELSIKRVIQDMLSEIDNDHTCVVKTEMVHARQAPGKFGRDEPWPGEMVVIPRMKLDRDDG